MDAMGINYKELMDNLFDGVCFVDKNKAIRYWNKAAENITGFTADEVLGKLCSESILTFRDHEGRDVCNALCPLENPVTDSSAREAELYLHHKDGRRIPVAIRITPIRDPEGSIIGVLELFSDISSKSATLLKIKELEKLSMTDTLTMLANRRYIQIKLESRLQELARFNWPFAVLYMDIDHFKKINDTYGHNVGDAVLKSVADALVASVRPFDLIGRWGGEEFIGIVRNVDTKSLYHIGGRLRQLVEASSVAIDQKKISVTVSAGGTMAKTDDTIEEIVKRADVLMFKSKAAGRNCLTISD